ncbi:hypothetical protein AgCh_039227 [Apium graveolens]
MGSITSFSGVGLRSFLSKFLSFLMPMTGEWDRHGLSDNIVLDINALSELKKYKVSDVTLIDNLTSKIIDGDDPIYKYSCAIYTKSQLQDLILLDGFFETLDNESKTKPDGTIGITVFFVELRWCASDSIKFINVGLMDREECTTSDKEPQGTEYEEIFKGRRWLQEEDGYVEALYVAGFNTERNFGYVNCRKAGDYSAFDKD